MALIRQRPARRDKEKRSSALAQAHSLRRAGLHDLAIHCLDEALNSELQHDHAFAGMALALKARSLVQVMDDTGAMLAVGLVPAPVRRLNPTVEACCQLVLGMVARRHAHSSWKSGSAGSNDLHMLVDRALDCFSKARLSAECGAELRLACVADLNRLYVEGLQAAIAGRSREVNPRLLVAAIQSEARARGKMPAEESAQVAGLTVIADLAVGAGLQPGELFELGESPSFRLAYRLLFGAGTGTWAEHLLRASTTAGVPTDQKARALVLGSRCLVRDAETADEGLVRSYVVHLTDCDCTLPKVMGRRSNGRQTSLVPGLSEQLTSMHLTFRPDRRGRRLFR